MIQGSRRPDPDRAQGDVALNALNTYAGTTYIGGTASAAPDTMWVWANTLADTGTASSLGTGANVVFASHFGGLIYTGGAASTNRTLALNRDARRDPPSIQLGQRRADLGRQHHHHRCRPERRCGWAAPSSATTNGDGIADDPNIISGVISDGAGVTRIQG